MLVCVCLWAMAVQKDITSKAILTEHKNVFDWKPMVLSFWRRQNHWRTSYWVELYQTLMGREVAQNIILYFVYKYMWYNIMIRVFINIYKHNIIQPVGYIVLSIPLLCQIRFIFLCTWVTKIEGDINICLYLFLFSYITLFTNHHSPYPILSHSRSCALVFCTRPYICYKFLAELDKIEHCTGTHNLYSATSFIQPTVKKKWNEMKWSLRSIWIGNRDIKTQIYTHASVYIFICGFVCCVRL